MAYLPSAPDLRDLYRRGSGMTLRRLGVLIRALPYDAPLWTEVRAAVERENKPTADQIRERQEAYRKRNEAARAKEASQ